MAMYPNESNFYDDDMSPRPDRHGVASYPIESTTLVLPYGDQHGSCEYPINSSGDVLPRADHHDGDMSMHPGQPKPGSWKD